MASCASLYEVLGIPASASEREIRDAYRRLARTCHPDVVSVARKEASANEFIKIHAAYSTLSDPSKRADYDRDLHLQRQRFVRSAAVSPFSTGFYAYGSRNWETDQCW